MLDGVLPASPDRAVSLKYSATALGSMVPSVSEGGARAGLLLGLWLPLADAGTGLPALRDGRGVSSSSRGPLAELPVSPPRDSRRTAPSAAAPPVARPPVSSSPGSTSSGAAVSSDMSASAQARTPCGVQPPSSPPPGVAPALRPSACDRPSLEAPGAFDAPGTGALAPRSSSPCRSSRTATARSAVMRSSATARRRPPDGWALTTTHSSESGGGPCAVASSCVRGRPPAARKRPKAARARGPASSLACLLTRVSPPAYRVPPGPGRGRPPPWPAASRAA